MPRTVITKTLARRLSLTASLLALLLPLAGCGGGSNSLTARGVPPATTTLTGTVVPGTGGSASGDRVIFDGNSALSTATNSQGQFTLTVPTSDVTGNDTLEVLNSQGVVLQTQAVSSTSGITISLPVVPPKPTNLNPL